MELTAPIDASANVARDESIRNSATPDRERNPVPGSISVVVPAFNAGRFLRETLESVLAQTLLPTEIIVMDDGSTDDTFAIASSFGAPVRVIRQANAGPSMARNRGVEVAQGEWIALLDADDLWEPDKLNWQMQALKATPGADVCYTARVQFAQEGGTIRRGKVLLVPPPSGLRQALYRNTTFLPSSILIRRSAYLAAGGFDPAMNFMEDWDFWLRLLHSGTQFACCPDPLLLYRVDGASISHQSLPLAQAAAAIYRRNVLPRLPTAIGWLRYNRVVSEHEAAAATHRRSIGHPHYLGEMTHSILRDPFHGRRRYKIWLHMLYTTLKRMLYPSPN